MSSFWKVRLASAIAVVSVALAAAGVRAAELEADAQTGAIHLAKATSLDAVPRHLEIESGKSIPVTTEFSVKRVSVGNPETLDVVVLAPSRLQFVAKRVGATNVIIWDPSDTAQAVIDVEVGSATTHVARKIQRVVGNEKIHVENAGGSFVLSGTVDNAAQGEHTVKIAKAFLGEDADNRLINMLEVGGGQQVMLEVVVAEMSRSLARSLGTNFHTVIGHDGSTFEFFNFLGNLTSVGSREFTFDLDTFELTSLETLIEISDNVTFGATGWGIGTGVYELFFDILEQEGLGKIMAEPTLVARSGETANFLVGGEIAIPVAQGGAFGSITVEYKPFGVGLYFTPTVLSDGRIHLSVAPEVSAPDFTLGTTVDGTAVPGFRTRRAATAIELGDGQSFAIAGLLSEDLAEIADKYPILGDLPVLGMLFSSSSFRKRETELVMIVTPRLVKPLPPGPHALPTDHFIEPSAFEFYLLRRLEGRSEAPAAPSTAYEPKTEEFPGLIGGAGHRISVSPEGGVQ